MKKSTIIKLVAGVVVAVALIVGLMALAYGWFDEDSTPEELTSDTGLTGGVAATVNGVEIDEDKVTRAINNMRINYGYTEDDEWKDYLDGQSKTIESTRYEVIGELVDQELVKQCASQRDVATDEEEIQSYVDKMAEQYSSEEAWLNAVDEAGWESLDKYKESLEFSILEEKLQNQFDAEVEAELEDDEAMVAELQDSAASYTGAKRTSRILFSDEDQDLANEVYEKINNGELSFEDAVSEYSIDEDTKEDGGDMGWDKIETLTTEYTEAITELEEGAITEPTGDKYGLSIIKVTEEWTAPETITAVSEVPEAIVDLIRENAIETDGDARYEDWLAGIHPDNDIQVNPIPDEVPYWVDLTDVEDYDADKAAEETEKALRKVVTGSEEEESADEDGSDAVAEDSETASDETEASE